MILSNGVITSANVKESRDDKIVEDEESLARSGAGAFVSRAGDVVFSRGSVYSIASDAMLSFQHLRDIRRQWCLSSHLIPLFSLPILYEGTTEPPTTEGPPKRKRETTHKGRRMRGHHRGKEEPREKGKKQAKSLFLFLHSFDNLILI